MTRNGAYSRDRQRVAVLVTVAVGLMAASTPLLAHSGGLNAQGCHTNRKTGDYHCHRPQTAPHTVTVAPRSSTTIPRSSAQAMVPSVAAGRAFRNCAEARAAGAAPVRRGDAGYGSHLDRDNDGIGCE